MGRGSTPSRRSSVRRVKERGMDNVQLVADVLDLGFPAVVLLLLFGLWGEYRKQVQGRIEDLREMCGMRPSIAVASERAEREQNT